jgi:CO/xanthine dehydrogenase FAD-binding subunit
MVTFYRRLPPIDYHIANSIDDVFKLFDVYGTKAKIINGGTDIIPKLKRREIKSVTHLIDIKNIPDLNFIKYSNKEGLSIGALSTISQLESSPIVKKKYAALFNAVQSMASVQVRNRGTIVGNICNAVPSADTAPALLVLDAEVEIVSSKGNRKVKIDKFFTGPGKTVIEPNEILTAINIPIIADDSKGKYIKLTVRHAMELAMVGVAVQLIMDKDVCKDIKLALGAVSPVPMRAKNAEAVIRGKTVDDVLIDKAATEASRECSPISDVRASADYRREMVKVLTKRAITQTISGVEK